MVREFCVPAIFFSFFLHDVRPVDHHHAGSTIRRGSGRGHLQHTRRTRSLFFHLFTVDGRERGGHRRDTGNRSAGGRGRHLRGFGLAMMLQMMIMRIPRFPFGSGLQWQWLLHCGRASTSLPTGGR